jgi:hypothetical protein
MDERGMVLGRFPFTEPFNLWKLVHLVDYVLQQTLFLRRSALETAGPLDESLHYTMDWDLLIRLGKRFPLAYLPEPLASIREYPAAKSFAGGGKRLREITRMLRRHSGRRWPPGVWVYGLERWRRGPLAPIAGRWADRLRREAQGLYRDGWAAPRLRYMLPPGPETVALRGLAPVEMTLEVRANGRSAGSFEAGPGAFEIRFPARGLANLEIRASRWVRPASDEGNMRRLAFVLKDVTRVP